VGIMYRTMVERYFQIIDLTFYFIFYEFVFPNELDSLRFSVMALFLCMMMFDKNKLLSYHISLCPELPINTTTKTIINLPY